MEKKASSSSVDSENTITNSDKALNTYLIDYALSLEEDMYLSSLEAQEMDFEDKINAE